MLERKKKMIVCTAEEWFKGYPFQAFKISNKKYIQDLHYHDYVQIWYVKKGQCVHCLDNVEHNLAKGDIFILPPYIPHKIISEDAEKTELLCCGFQVDFISEKDNFDAGYIMPFMQDMGEIKPFFTLDGNAVKEVEKIFDEIIYEYDHKEKFFELYVKANILKLLSIIVRKYNKSSHADNSNIFKYRDSILKVLEFIKENSKEKLFVEDVCKIAAMSPTYFSHVFKQFTGQTFVEYLRTMRVSNAKEMLLNTDKKIADVAIDAGFDDPAYFDRVFKKEVGVSPRQFRTAYTHNEVDKTT